MDLFAAPVALPKPRIKRSKRSKQVSLMSAFLKTPKLTAAAEASMKKKEAKRAARVVVKEILSNAMMAIFGSERDKQGHKLCQRGVCKIWKRGRQLNDCRSCSDCGHGKAKGGCKICSDCGHGKLKTNCSICSNCGHGKTKKDCAICSNCGHGKVKGNCFICSDCGHGKRKQYCSECPGGGQKLCITCKLFVMDKWKSECLVCRTGKGRIHAKELRVVAFLRERLPDRLFEFVHDKAEGKGECSGRNYRPDVRFTEILGTHPGPRWRVIIEVDENRHDGADYNCDAQRMCDIAADSGLAHHFIRYNPDGRGASMDAILPVLRECFERAPSEQFEPHYLFY